MSRAFSGVISPRDPDFKAGQITSEPIIGNVRDKVKVLLVLTVVSFADIGFKWHRQFNEMDGFPPFIMNHQIGF